MTNFDENLTQLLAIHGLDSIEAPLLLLEFIAQRYVKDDRALNLLFLYLTCRTKFHRASTQILQEDKPYVTRLRIAVHSYLALPPRPR
jgi:hypothetical protein